MAGLRLATSSNAETRTIFAGGELDLENVEVLDAALTSAEEGGTQRILLDLTGLKFIDSTGLTALLRAGRRSLRDGGRLEVRAGTGEVARMLRLTAIDQTLQLIR